MNINPGYLLVRPHYLRNVNTTQSSSSQQQQQQQQIIIEENIRFGGVCSFLLDPATSFFFEPEQFQQSQKVANLFCGWLYNFSTPNATHTNFFFTKTANTTEDPRPGESYLRNLACKDEDFLCSEKFEEYNNDDSLFDWPKSHFARCSYEFFYRSPIYGTKNDNPNQEPPAALPCVFGNIAGLHCMAPVTTTTTTTTVASAPTTATTSSSSSSSFVPLNLPNKSSYLFTKEGLRIGKDWIVRLNASANNRLEVRNASSSENENENNKWGVVCDSTWNNDIARMWCKDFFGFTNNNASVFKANPSSSPNFNPNAIDGFPFLWGPAPSCSGCTGGNLDHADCEVRDYIVEDCVVGEEIGLFCQNSDDDNGQAEVVVAQNNTSQTEVFTIENGGYEWRMNLSKAGLVEVRPLLVHHQENSSMTNHNNHSSNNTLLPFGLIRFTSDDLVTSDTLCRWFGFGGGGNARSPEDIEENFLSVIPPLDHQPCYLSWIKCFTRDAPSLSYCMFNTNNAEHCGGTQYAQYLNCSHPPPVPTATKTKSITLSQSEETLTYSNYSTTTHTISVVDVVTAPPPTPEPTPAPPPPPLTAAPPRDPGGVLDFSSGSILTRGGTAVIGVGLGIGFFFLTVIVIFLLFAFRNKKIVVDCLEGIRSAEEHEIEDEREDERLEQQFREERNYRSSLEEEDENFIMEMTPKHANDFDSFYPIVHQQQPPGDLTMPNENNNQDNNNGRTKSSSKKKRKQKQQTTQQPQQEKQLDVDDKHENENRADDDRGKQKPSAATNYADADENDDDIK